MPYTEKLSEELTLVATIDPAPLAGAATIYSDVVNMAYHRRALVVLLSGPATTTKMVATAGTLTIFECTAAGTLASTALKTVTVTRAQTTAAMGQQKVTEVRDTELGTVHAAYTQYFKCKLVAGTNAANFGLVVLADNSRYSDAVTNDLATNTIS